MTPKQQHAALKVAIKREIVVLDALGDSEMRFLNVSQVWSRATEDAGLAYGYSETRVRIVPTAREIAQAETVADWLAWLGHHHGACRGSWLGPTMIRSGAWQSESAAASGRSTTGSIGRLR